GERIRRRRHKPDDAECEERAAVTCEALFRPDRAPRQQPAAGHDPADCGEQDEDDQRSSRPGDGVQGRRVSVSASPEAERCEDEEERAAPGPEAESAAVTAE